MEVPVMEEGKNEKNPTAPVAFVEGGIQDACDDSCSICLEAFCDSDPGTVTSCKHEFHLQCILEWCQRSSNCPMCWQAITLKDPSSQELLEAVEQERKLRLTPTRNSTIFRHPTLGDIELQIPVDFNDGELEDRIIQHLAGMGRTHHVGRRDGSRNRSSAHGRPRFLVLTPPPNASSSGPVGGEALPVRLNLASPSVPLTASGVETVQPMPALGTSVNPRSSGSQSSVANEDRAGPSEFQTVSDSWKTRFNALSMRYKESITKSTRGWKERLFNKSPSMPNGETNREITEISNVSRLTENNRQDQDRDSTSSSLVVEHDSISSDLADDSEENNHRQHQTPPNDHNTTAASAALD